MTVLLAADAAVAGQGDQVLLVIAAITGLAAVLAAGVSGYFAYLASQRSAKTGNGWADTITADLGDIKTDASATRLDVATVRTDVATVRTDMAGVREDLRSHTHPTPGGPPAG